jgi:transcriptional regulator with XRE-family HTH domain
MNTTSDSFMTMVGERIQTARRQLKLTQRDLSDRLGFKDRQILGNIESGQRKVSAEEMLKLLQVLGKDLDYFTDPYLITAENAFSWRAQNVPAVLDTYEPKARNLVAANRRFSGLLKEQPTPITPTLALTKKSSFEDAANAGDALAREWKMGDTPAAELRNLVETQFHYLVLYVDCPTEISGAACRVTGCDAILINRKEPAGRQNFDLGHEVFHLLTWDAMPPGRIDVPIEDQGNAPRVERMAENFAAGILMPVHVLKPRWDTRGDKNLHGWILATAQDLQVSGRALYWRLRNLGWLSDGDALDIDPGRLAQRANATHRAPSLPPLYSEAFVERLHKVLDSGLVSVRKAADLMDCTVEDIADLFGTYNKKVPFDL